MKDFDNSKILIIGLGLIGGSFAKALKKNNITANIYAFDKDQKSLEDALNDNIIDEKISDLKNISTNFDLIIIATPISFYEEFFNDIPSNSYNLIIDFGSVKNFENLKISKKAREKFIPCHPIAGLETSGFENSSEDLFKNKKFLVCANKNNEEAKKIANLAIKINAIPEFIEAKKHDEIYALISHLPQFLSYLSKDFAPKNISQTTLKKSYRLDDSNPEIWSDIFNFNAENIEEFYLEFFDNLEDLFKLEKNLLLKNIIEFSNNFKCQSIENIDFEYFQKNFNEIFFKILIVISYLKIPKIKQFQNFAGSGFNDFTSIISILKNIEKEQLENLINNNYQKLRKLFDSLN
jgi:prephenate dehydrogenase